MKSLSRIAPVLFLMSTFIAGCSTITAPEITYDPQVLRFTGERAYNLEEEFVTEFTNRHSGTDQNRLATEWLRERFEAAGWSCQFDDWEIINYSQDVALRNVVCKLPGADSSDPREILVTAHHDQAPTTVQGADNDGSGIAILLHLAEIFAAEGPPRYTLAFVCTDAEEYGMLGSRRYVQTHPNPDDIIAGFSLDNLGRTYYDDMKIELIGQFSSYGPVWLPSTARGAAAEADSIQWQVHLRAPLDQALDQAVPVSLMDQGPMVQAGVPALGFAGREPPELSDLHYHLWHDPDDTMEYQSAEALGQSGLIAEALIHQLLSMETFPEESGPYLYFDDSQSVLRGVPLYLIFIAFAGIFFLGSILTGRSGISEKIARWRKAAPHYLGLWLPLVATVLLLYLYVELGIFVKYHLYPATTKDPEMLHPDWIAVAVFLLTLGLSLYIGRLLVRRYAGALDTVEFRDIKSLAFLVIGLVGIYIVIANPFSLLFLVPVLFWFLIRGWKGIAKTIDILFFLLGGLLLYALIYQFGFVVLRYGIVFLWMFLNFISTGTFSFLAVAAGTAVLAAGLSLVVNPPRPRRL